MNLLERLEHWGDSHHPKWLDIVRVCLGLFLIYKGIEFYSNMGNLMNLMHNTFTYSDFTLIVIGHYIIFAHILGGFLLVLGLLTRFACLIQIPVLIGAIIFVNTSGDLFRPFSELLLSVVVLGLLIYFLIVGNGPWSFARFFPGERA